MLGQIACMYFGNISSFKHSIHLLSQPVRYLFINGIPMWTWKIGLDVYVH